MARRICSYLNGIPHPCILDVGCAEGYLIEECQKTYGANVQGLEFSHHALSQARSSIASSIITGNMLEVHIPPRSFDAVLCFDVLEYMTREENQEAAARLVSWARGLIFFANPYRHSFHASQKRNPDPLRLTAFTQKEYKKIFADAGAAFVEKFTFSGSGGDVLVFRPFSV